MSFLPAKSGSCNDVLEVRIRANEPPVKLQRGPKSYSFGPFVRALELCRVASVSEPSGEDAKDRAKVNRNDCERTTIDDEGLEAYLDSYDNASDDIDYVSDEGDSDEDATAEGEDFGDSLYSTPAISNAAQTGRSAETSMLNDIHALDALKKCLQNVRTGLLDNSLAGQFHGEWRKTDEDDNNKGGIGITNLTVEDQYCLILIRSEIETVDFYLAAISELSRQLVERLSELDGPTVSAKVVKGDWCVREESLSDQITAVTTTFLSIRYP